MNRAPLDFHTLLLGVRIRCDFAASCLHNGQLGSARLWCRLAALWLKAATQAARTGCARPPAKFNFPRHS